MLAIGALVLLFGLLSKRFESSLITPPLFFAAGGLLVGASGLGLVDPHGSEGIVHLFAELTLVLVLFSDAATIDARELRRDYAIPLRMLAFGLPFAVLLGTLAGMWLMPELGWYGAGLLAAILAPTDAALGQAVISNERVPLRIRTSLTTESGLNDGLALPLVLVFAACSEAHGQDQLLPWVGYATQQLTLGPLIGAAVGLLGAKALSAAERRGTITMSFEQLIGLSLAVISFGAAEHLGGNGFIAAFLAGLVFGNAGGREQHALREFSEAEGQLLSLITFCLFGALFVMPAVQHWTPQVVLYAALSLTVVRMLPILLSLLGTGLRPQTSLFLAWFGPRGLASILFALLILDRSDLMEGEEVFPVVVLTVAASIVLHGITATPLAKLYGTWAERSMSSEHAEVSTRTPTQ